MIFKQIELKDKEILDEFLGVEFELNLLENMDFSKLNLSQDLNLDINNLSEAEKTAIFINSKLCKAHFASDISFVNLYLWRHSRRISWAIIDGFCVIETQYKDQAPFIFMPLAGASLSKSQDLNEKLGEVLLKLKIFYEEKNEKLQIKSINNYELDLLKSLNLGTFKLEARRDRAEYIYDTNGLVRLAGKKYHKKKNHLNKFYASFANAQYEAICDKNIRELLNLNEALATKLSLKENGENSGLFYEYLGIKDALSEFKALGLRGGLIRINGEIIAFSFGELRSVMALIHIEKALSEFDGAYQAINQAVLEHEFSSSILTNREEDLGIDGLRQAKMSYRPLVLLEKFDTIFE